MPLTVRPRRRFIAVPSRFERRVASTGYLLRTGHKHHTVIDGVNLYHKCKPHSDTYYMPSPTRKPTPSPPTPPTPPHDCGKKCSRDSDCAIGGFLQYPICYTSPGTRCEGFCGPPDDF